jgi:hypothetical protein
MIKHGHSASCGRKASPTYRSWRGMITRTSISNRQDSKHYIDKGIVVCDRWRKFENFLADMGERPADKTLDRFPNRDGNYEPGNCRWATCAEQTRNRSISVLTFDSAVQVAIARLSGETCKSIAARFGCSENLPREIAKGRRWTDALEEAKRKLLPSGDHP